MICIIDQASVDSELIIIKIKVGKRDTRLMRGCEYK